MSAAVQLGHRLRCIRRCKGLTQAQVARTIGLSHQQVQKYECGGGTISVERLLQLCAALGASPSSIIEGL